MRRFLNMTGKPEGFLGRMMLAAMKHGHGKVADWGLDEFPDMMPQQMAELGCGAGAQAAKLLARYPEAKLTALDLSPLSVETARKTNAKAVASGRCQVLEGNVAQLPFADNSLDLATAFETIYFWPGLPGCFAEVRRCLRPGGYFILVNESDGRDRMARHYEQRIDGMKVYTLPEIRQALTEAGFTDFRSVHHHQHPWITVIARK